MQSKYWMTPHNFFFDFVYRLYIFYLSFSLGLQLIAQFELVSGNKYFACSVCLMLI